MRARASPDDPCVTAVGTVVGLVKRSKLPCPLDALDAIEENRLQQRWARVREDTVHTRPYRARLGLRQAQVGPSVAWRRTAA